MTMRTLAVLVPVFFLGCTQHTLYLKHQREASALIEQKRYEEAVTPARKALDHAVLAHGENDPVSLRSEVQLATVLAETGSGQEALRRLQRVQTVQRMTRATGRTDLRATLWTLAGLLSRSGSLEKAAERYRELADLAEASPCLDPLRRPNREIGMRTPAGKSELGSGPVFHQDAQGVIQREMLEKRARSEEQSRDYEPEKTKDARARIRAGAEMCHAKGVELSVVLESLGRVEMKLGHLESARKNLERALELRARTQELGNGADITKLLSKLLYKMAVKAHDQDRCDKAIELYRRSAELQADDLETDPQIMITISERIRQCKEGRP